MNIFVLDMDVKKCARYHADQHVVKMILESTQMLCTVLNGHHFKTPYKPTHHRHPCTIWANESLSNWKWLKKLTLTLNEEFKYRFLKDTDHRSAKVAKILPLPPIKDIGLTAFPQAMPRQYKVPGDPVQAYRNFYVGEKSAFATWTRRKRPKWFVRGLRERAASAV